MAAKIEPTTGLTGWQKMPGTTRDIYDSFNPVAKQPTNVQSDANGLNAVSYPISSSSSVLSKATPSESVNGEIIPVIGQDKLLVWVLIGLSLYIVIKFAKGK